MMYSEKKNPNSGYADKSVTIMTKNYNKALNEVNSREIFQKETLFVCVLDLIVPVEEFVIFLNLPKNTKNKVIITRICS